MAKSKHGRPEEHFLGLLRQLKAENRNLKKRLKELEKSKHIYEENDSSIEEETQLEQPKKKQTCPDCSKHSLREAIVINRMFMVCDLCGWRSKAKIVPTED